MRVVGLVPAEIRGVLIDSLDPVPGSAEIQNQRGRLVTPITVHGPHPSDLIYPFSFAVGLAQRDNQGHKRGGRRPKKARQDRRTSGSGCRYGQSGAAGGPVDERVERTPRGGAEPRDLDSRRRRGAPSGPGVGSAGRRALTTPRPWSRASLAGGG